MHLTAGQGQVIETRDAMERVQEPGFQASSWGSDFRQVTLCLWSQGKLLALKVSNCDPRNTLEGV